MAHYRGTMYRQNNGQYVWLFYKDEVFQEVGGVNVANLTAAYNAVRDKFGTISGIGNALSVVAMAQTAQECKARIFREPDGQYSWEYFRDGGFIKFGGSNVATLAAAVDAARDELATEPGIGTSKIAFIEAHV